MRANRWFYIQLIVGWWLGISGASPTLAHASDPTEHCRVALSPFETTAQKLAARLARTSEIVDLNHKSLALRQIEREIEELTRRHGDVARQRVADLASALQVRLDLDRKSVRNEEGTQNSGNYRYKRMRVFDFATQSFLNLPIADPKDGSIRLLAIQARGSRFVIEFKSQDERSEPRVYVFDTSNPEIQASRIKIPPGHIVDQMVMAPDGESIVYQAVSKPGAYQIW